MEQELTKSTRSRISVKEAIQQAKNWRDFIFSHVDSALSAKIPKAVYISRTDIQDLYKEMEGDPNLVGVRAYFTLKYPWTRKQKNHLKFVLVPVKNVPGYSHGKDILTVSPIKGDGDGDSDLYDFTKPCPDYCDTKSEMFGPSIYLPEAE
ncbi:hypothetical protein MUY27_13485 [Mucilaginibacter sp. RS28]|uniref:Uncharacterized protein n=1 Tax=Mucilaginibacter straminoryzae TaxID=2932774 RepID=A0A9X1X984_9SPHI|nr:hypothetical protein [Mucilaginibacter straminoryzae]MCJ8210724.1 hypothetical protein [Mucilaginibacter straminoryzae]